MNKDKVVNSKTVKLFLRNLIQLMEEYDGKYNEPDVIEESTGEILIWKYKETYCKNYAVIPLLLDGHLTPTVESVKESLLKRAQSQKIALLNEEYVLLPYGGEISNAIVTIGYVIRKISNISKL